MNWRTLPETKALGGGGFRRPLAFNVRVRVRDQCALPRRLDDLQSRSNSPWNRLVRLDRHQLPPRPSAAREITEEIVDRRFAVNTRGRPSR